MTTYATASDYAAYLGLEFPGEWDAAEIARIDAGLLRAQDDIGGQISFARYDYTDADIAAALKRATCARFEYVEETGDDGSGALSLYDNVGIGSVRLAKSAFASSRVANPLVEALGERAARILTNAGILSGAVYHS